MTDDLVGRSEEWGSVAYSSTPFAPVVGGEVLASDPWSALAGGSARDVDLLVGHTRDEYRLLAAHLPRLGPNDPGADVDALINLLTPSPGADRYRAAYAGATDPKLRETALSDWLYRLPALHLAEAADRGGSRVWCYELAWGFGPNGASHGLDTLLLFGTENLVGEVSSAGPAALASAARLGGLIRDDQVRFAPTGDPGWTPFTVEDPATCVYASDRVVSTYPEERSRSLWSKERFGVLDVVP